MLERLDFKPLSEGIGEYELPNGVRLIARILLMLAWKAPGTQKQQIRTQMVWNVVAPPALQGPPATTIDTNPTVTKVYKATDLKVIKRPESFYQVGDDVLLHLVLDVQAAKMTGSFDQNGEPILLVDSAQSLAVFPAKPPPPVRGSLVETRQSRRRDNRQSKSA